MLMSTVDVGTASITIWCFRVGFCVETERASARKLLSYSSEEEFFLGGEAHMKQST